MAAATNAGVTASVDEANRVRLPAVDTVGVTVNEAEAWMTLVTAATRDGVTDSEDVTFFRRWPDDDNTGVTVSAAEIRLTPVLPPTDILGDTSSAAFAM